MATANFGTPKYNLPLVADGLGVSDIDDLEMSELDYIYKERKQEIDEFNKDKRYFEIEMVAGYYEGWYYNIKDLQDYWNFEDIDELTDTDADYFFGEKAEVVRAEMKKEYDEIREKILSLTDEGAVRLERVATFSNGETYYKAV